MKISEKILKEWAELRSLNDVNLIAEKAKVDPSYVRRALRDGETSERVFVAIANFYKKKKERIAKLIR